MRNDPSFGIAVYYADVSPLADDALFGKLHSAVSEYRRKKTDRYYFRKDKNLSLGVEYLLMCACQDFGIRYREQTIRLGSCGKPYFSDSPVYFNLSHSEEKGMCILSPYEVGCDLEKISTCDMAAAKWFCSEEELTALLSCPSEAEKRLLFYRLWTMKESFIKCTGMGMSLPLHSISFLSNGKIKTDYQDGENRYLLWEGKTEDAYQYALCIKAEKDTAHSDTLRNQIRFIPKTLLPQS